MISWSIYSFSLLAIFVIGGRAFPCQKTRPKRSPISYDFYAEKYVGKYTGPWEADTLSCFNRVPAVIQHDLRKNGYEQRVVSFAVDEKPSDRGIYKYTVEYARDSRKNETHSLANPYHIYYLNANNCTKTEDYQKGMYPLNCAETDVHHRTYPINKEAVWQIPIPEDHVAYVILTSFALEEAQGGSCINDYVSMYKDNDTPTKFCSSLEQVRREFEHNETAQLTIKFQSNGANNTGGFSGAVWLRQNNRQQRSLRDVETVSGAEEQQGNENELQIKQAIDCLVDIAKHGESAAAEYREEPPNAECKKMAEAFFKYMKINN